MRKGVLSPRIIAMQQWKRAWPELEVGIFAGLELPDLAEI